MITDFRTVKLTKGSKVRAEAVIFYGENGWKAKAWYLDDPKSQVDLGSGTKVYTHEGATAHIAELAESWRKAETERGRY